MLTFEFMDAHRDQFRKGIPDQNKHLTSFIISTLAESTFDYDRHLKHIKSGKRKYPVHFRLLVTRLNRFITSHFTEEVNRVWQQVVQDSNRQPVNKATGSKLLVQKHAPRIACLRFLLACLVDHPGGTDGDKPGNKPSLPPAISDFVDVLIRGMRELQQQGEAQESFRLVQSGKGKREATVRDFFRTICAGKYEVTAAESLKGKGHIDLKVYDVVNKTWLIVEFKGYWNKDRGKLVHQLLGYVTDAEGYAFTMTINHLKKDITLQHRQCITRRKTGFIAHSWEVHEARNITYFSSCHQLNGRVIKLFHFVLSIPRQKC